ncbi:MAG: hypothetical protein WBM28_12900 [Burkholderiales bacterium]
MIDAHPDHGRLRARAAPEMSHIGPAGECGDLFAGKRIPRRSPAIRRRLAPELTAARVLCHQLRRKQASPDKKRIAHLICLNLLAILKQRSRRP